MKHKEQRVGVFVDVSNMYHSAKHLFRANVNFAKVLEGAVAGRKLIRAIAYVVKAQSMDENNFFDALTKQGFEVKSKDLQVFWGGQKKGDWDVGITIDAVLLANKLDAVVLVTGDGDYIPLVNYLQSNKGCFVEVMAFGESCSSKLKEVADEFTDLSGGKEKVFNAGKTDKAEKKKKDQIRQQYNMNSRLFKTKSFFNRLILWIKIKE